MKRILMILLLSSMLHSCAKKKVAYNNYNEYPTDTTTDLWLAYTTTGTTFKIWSPTADQVQVHLYTAGQDGKLIATHKMNAIENGVWSKQIEGDLHGTYYTYQTMINDVWLEETPGIYAKAVGVNGKRAMVLNNNTTNPDQWSTDKGPALKYPNQAIIYELHIRDMTIHPQSGSSMPGTYTGLVETGTKGPENVSTGIDHLKELGITHVHLLPTFDHYSIDESKLNIPQYNWGYDPQNYNVPEGSFSSDPYHAEVRIKEFKTMVKTFHDHGIGVILDVVYNHTGKTDSSNFNLEVPGYYYRHWEDHKLSDASACGNETASEKEMMRKFMLESVSYWAKEYHLDGFRFDLMGIHDIQTMNDIAATVKKINPSIFIYGEGWTAGDSPLPIEKRALKKNTAEMPRLSAFSDDIRDGLKGSVFEESSTGFVSGAKNMQESVKMGIVGAIEHPQIDYKKVNYSNTHWTLAPWQSVSYVSCHDNHTLLDKLNVSRKDATIEQITAMDKLANAVVMTSQGIAFIHAGSEMLRTKHGEHNSYNLPDSINNIDWNWKVTNTNVVSYYKNLIALRKAHPAFYMQTADQVRTHLNFIESKDNLISYQINNHANGDSWNNIYVVYNASPHPIQQQIIGNWQIAVLGDHFDLTEGKKITNNTIEIPGLSMFIAYQK